VNTREEKPKVYAKEIFPLTEVIRRYTKQVHLRLPVATTRPQQLEQVRDIVARHSGRVPLILCFTLPGGELVFADTHAAFCVTPSEELTNELESLLGKGAVYLKPDTSPPRYDNDRERYRQRGQ
ncbi:MAG: hypothetical protein N2689_03125, partial [Verrucomicrobiae bacterium]|nr:hypothetical protein [Verrucomicrobiae bacterium]